MYQDDGDQRDAPGLSPGKKKTKEVCEAAVRQNGLAIRNVPLPRLTSCLIVMAVENTAEAVKYISPEKLTEKFLIRLVTANRSCLKWVPKDRITEKVILAAA